jgi:trehalose 6-phosphate phosphatase
MKPLFSSEGRAALDAMMGSGRPLLAFDFDGTLSPIVARPDDACVPLPVARRMQLLCERWCVAVISGRAVADVSARLGFEPMFVVGNHGIEDPQDSQVQRWAAALAPLRERLRPRADALEHHGVTVEDKGLSVALHYRLAPDAQRARQAIGEVLKGDVGNLTIGTGKCVVNLVPKGAPDKGDALLSLARRCRAEAGLFVGDDDNDEPAFAKAPARWITVRMAAEHKHSRAAYYVDGPPQLPALLQMLLDFASPA